MPGKRYRLKVGDEYEMIGEYPNTKGISATVYGSNGTLIAYIRCGPVVVGEFVVYVKGRYYHYGYVFRQGLGAESINITLLEESAETVKKLDSKYVDYSPAAPAFANDSITVSMQPNAYVLTNYSGYTNMINSNPDWEMAGLFTDDGISGTGTKKRDGFMGMIAACEEGRVEISLPKWIQSHKSETALKSLEIRHFTAFATSSAALGEGRFSVLCG